jgi:hypothetical protein
MQSKPSTVRFGRGAQRQRAVVGVPQRSVVGARERPWSRLSWPLSIALFAAPAALALLTLFLPSFAAPPETVVRVTDRYAGTEISGAQIVADGVDLSAGPDGTVTIPLSAEATEIMIQAPGYEAVKATLNRDAPRDWPVALRPNVLTGQLKDASTAKGISGATVAIVAPDGGEIETTTDDDGRYSFEGVPDGATVRFSSADHGQTEQAIEQRTSIDVAMQASFVAGQVRDVQGNPIAGARIAAENGTAETIAGEDGTFRLTGGSDVQEVLVSAAGFGTQSFGVDASRQIEAQLEGEMVRAVYANLGVLGDEERWNTLLEIAETTEINAIVIDVKQDTIYYDTQVQFFRDVPGMVTPVIDLQDLLAQMEERGIYSIARMVVFKDPVVAAGRPDLAVRDEVTGGPWLDMNGTPWVNAFEEELWQANADLGAELAQLGFDEVQYDYIRFPSDGDLRTADFGNDYSEEKRRAAITGAVALGSERVRAAGANFAIDLFPIIALFGDDQGIGQTLQDLEPLADYVCLMIYPSHYELGNIPVDGHPNDFPAETVTFTLEKTEALAPGSMKKMRPWLQDFTYPLEGYSVYGSEEVRAQIDAAEAMGVSGWLLWNAAGEFEIPALNPE